MTNKKRILSSLILLILVCTIVNATSVEVVFDKESVEKEGKVIASVNIVDVSQLHSYQFALKYDNTMLKLDIIEEGTFLSQGEQGKTYVIVKGNTIAVTTLGPQSKSGSGNLFKATFTAIGAGYVKLDLIAGKLINPDLESVQFNIVPDTLTIMVGGETTPYCGDKRCDTREDCRSCPQDCGVCPTPAKPTEVGPTEPGPEVSPTEPGPAQPGATNLGPILLIVIVVVIVIGVFVFVLMSKKKGPKTKAYSSGMQSADIRKIQEYARYWSSQGIGKEDIKNSLRKKGWSRDIINKALK